MNADIMPLLKRYLDDMEHAWTGRTPGNRCEILTRADRELPFGLELATTDELKAWLYKPRQTRDGERPKAKSSIGTYWGALAGFYAWAFDPRNPWLEGVNPWAWMPPRPRVPPGQARPVENDQLRRILTQAAQPFRLWALIAAYQGLRCCEIAGLDREHITQVRLFVAYGKGGKQRAHDTDPQVWQAVRDLPPGPLAIDWRTGQRASARFVSVKFAQHCRLKLGMPGVSMHMLRHWLGVTTLDETDNIRVVQEMLGHDALSSTQIYTRATVKQQRAARARLPRLAG
jgi:integrase/recombinase XerC